MLSFLSVLGGAAFLEAKKVRGKGEKDELKRLREKEEHLQRLVEHMSKELDQERELHKEVEDKLIQLSTEHSSLRETTEAERQQHALERTRLVGQAALLFRENFELASRATAVEREVKHLADSNEGLVKERQEMQEKLLTLKAEREEHIRRQEEVLAALKDELGQVLNKLWANQITAEEAGAELKALGCEVKIAPPAAIEAAPEPAAAAITADAKQAATAAPAVLTGPATSGRASPADAQSYTYQTKLILDNPDKLQRLMAACRSNSGGSDSPKIATLTFPSSGNSGSLSSLDSAQLRINWGGRDVGKKDNEAPAVAGHSKSDASPTTAKVKSAGALAAAPGTPPKAPVNVTIKPDTAPSSADNSKSRPPLPTKPEQKQLSFGSPTKKKQEAPASKASSWMDFDKLTGASLFKRGASAGHDTSSQLLKDAADDAAFHSTSSRQLVSK